MKFDIVTIFPKIFDSYINESMIKRARVARPAEASRHPGLKGLGTKKLVDIKIHDLRKFSRDKHRKVDDRPYGGGPGMVLKVEPIIRAIESFLKPSIFKRRTKIILFSAAGKQFNAKMAADWAKNYDRVIMIAGRYEGVDERIKKLIGNWKLEIENLSIGPYVLTGGELPAMVVVDAVSRHLPGFLGKQESLEEKRHGVGVPVYTRPEAFVWKGKKYTVPRVLLSGDHKKIVEWRKKHAG